MFAVFEEDFFDCSAGGGGDGGEHFHGFEDDEFVAFGDGVSGGDGNLGDHAGEGGGDVVGVGGVGFLVDGDFFAEALVDDGGFARHAVELVEEGADAVFVGFANGEEFDEEGFAGGDVDVDFLADGHAVEEGGGGEHGEAVEFFEGVLVVGEDLGIHEVGVEVDGGSAFAGADGVGLFVAEDGFLDVGRPAAVGLAEAAHEHVDVAFEKVAF